MICSDGMTPTQKLNNKKILRMAKEEKVVQEVILTYANVLYIAVKSDGTNRTGLAN